MLIYNAEDFKELINLRFFYAAAGNENMKAQCDRDIDEMIANRIASKLETISYLPA